jgi:hypothetical protein
VEGTFEWVNGAPSAGSRFEAKIERRDAPRARRTAALIADIAGGLLESQPMFDISRYLYRVRVIDRVHGSVVHDQNWRGDEAGARGSFDDVERDLGELNVADFCAKYGISLGSNA